MTGQDLCAWLRSEDAMYEVVLCFDKLTLGFRRDLNSQEQVRWALVRYMEEMRAHAINDLAVARSLDWMIRKPEILDALWTLDEMSEWSSLPARIRVVGEFCARALERASNDLPPP